jgi:hypothetical protein
MTSFAITPLTDHTGAEVIGLDFTQPIDSESKASISVNRRSHQDRISEPSDGSLSTHPR